MSPDDPRHGTYAGYNAGCRLQCCRDAAARYQRGLDWDRLNGRSRSVDKFGTVRRIRALQALGWSAEELSRRIGHSRAYLHMVINHTRGTVHRTTAEKVAAVYDELCMTPGPSPLTRTRARRNGWLPPLAYDDIDAPDGLARPTDATVDLDPVVVERILAGDWRLSANRAERAEVVRRWTGSLNELERLTSWNTARDLRRMRDGEASVA
jgi:hypothetical protein